MKSEKVLGLLACALACTISGSAFANTTNSWFGVKPTGTDIGLASVTTNGVAVTVENSSIQIDGDSETALTFTPTVATPALSDGLVTITSSAVLTPSDVSDLGPVDGAHAGFAVAVDNNVTNFYGYASAGGAGDTPAWIKLNGAPSNPEEATTFTIALNYRDSKVSFYQGDTLLANETTVSEFNISNNFTCLNYVSAYGSGSISSVTSQYEVAVAAVVDGASTNLYGSASEAVVATRNGGSVQDITADGKATETPQAANGLCVWECDVLGIAPDATIALQPATKEVASDKIAVALSGYTPVDGVTVKFKVKQGNALVSETEYDADAIGIPMTTGTYTVVPTITATPAP